MKKKCTNSKCRKVFDFRPGRRVTCPCCGKAYPRLNSGSKKEEEELFELIAFAEPRRFSGKYALAMTDITERIPAISMHRRLSGTCSLAASRQLVEDYMSGKKKAPLILQKNLSRKTAVCRKREIDNARKNKSYFQIVVLKSIGSRWKVYGRSFSADRSGT